jgi:hypothetical protein
MSILKCSVSSTTRLSGLYTNQIPESGYLLADKSKVKLTMIEMTSKKETLFEAFLTRIEDSRNINEGEAKESKKDAVESLMEVVQARKREVHEINEERDSD